MDEFFKNSEIKQILQFYANTSIDARKKKIYAEIEPLLKIEHSFFWLPDIEETILLAFNANLNTFANKLIVIYEGYLSAQSGKHKDQSGLKYVKFKREILEIYQNKKLPPEEKLHKLNSLESLKKFDFQYYRENNKFQQCKEYEKFIRALIFFNNEPIKTFKLLRDLFKVKKTSLYLFNMLSAYFKAFQNSDYKVEKYINLLNDYQTDIDQLIIQDNSLFNFQVLFVGYTEVGNHTKLNELYDLAPSYYKQILQKELPNTLKLFDKQIYIKSKLLVCVEGQHDMNFLKNINSCIIELKDIIDIKSNTNIALFDLKGSNLQQFVKDHNLHGTNIIELHIYDSDKGSGKNENKYTKECEEVKNRDDLSFCFMTKKRELENYIHKNIIEEEFGIDMSTIKNWDIEDIPTFIKNKNKNKTEKAIKCILNGKLSKQITKQSLEDLNAFDEIKSWFEKIKELSSV